MHDGLCACGTCFVPGYAEAREYAETGAFVSFFIVEPDGILLSAYAPTENETAVFHHPEERVRAAGHIALAVHTRHLEGD